MGRYPTHSAELAPAVGLALPTAQQLFCQTNSLPQDKRCWSSRDEPRALQNRDSLISLLW